MSSFYDNTRSCPKCGHTPINCSDSGSHVYTYICDNCKFESKNFNDFPTIMPNKPKYKAPFTCFELGLIHPHLSAYSCVKDADGQIVPSSDLLNTLSERVKAQDAELAQLREENKRLREVIHDLLYQFAYDGRVLDGNPSLATGGLSALEDAFDILEWTDPYPTPDLLYQFAYDGRVLDGNPSLATGGLSALEDAFDILEWTDPYPTPDRKCDMDGCSKRATCGTPTKDGYKNVCSKHYQQLSAQEVKP